MRTTKLVLSLLILGAGISGCSQTGSLRTGNPEDVKTTASIGDRPLSVAAGLPGDSVRAETAVPDNSRIEKGRISGRVYDDQGQAVANARVRLAVGGEPGGKAVFATTDRSGAFTLRGVRPGSAYTVIAEYQGDQGMMSGRADADALDTDVKIGLHLRDAGTGARDTRTAAVSPDRSSVKAISKVEEIDESEEVAPPRNKRTRANQEDLNAPIDGDERGDEISRVESTRSRIAKPAVDPDDDLDAARPGWSSGQRSSRNLKAEQPESFDVRDDAYEDVEENPLPPAREISKVSNRREPARGDRDAPVRTADASRASAKARSARPNDDELPPAAEMETETEAGDEGVAPRQLPDGLISGARTVRPEAYAPIMLGDPNPSPKPSRAKATSPARPKPVTSEDRSERSAALESPPAEQTRPKWSDVVSQNHAIPLDEALVKTVKQGMAATTTSALAASPGAPAVIAASSNKTASPLKKEKADDRSPLIKRKAGPYCEYDAGERRLIDFALPDADGRMVSIRDFDADLILLDFWGTWCVPCRKSIPHLKELQASLGDKRIQVVGIACERTAADVRSAKVADVIKETGINYPVLITGMDGTCPVQEELQIQFYPTMILIDREGRVLLREQGATDATLARMDRFIAKHLDRAQPAVAVGGKADADARR